MTEPRVLSPARRLTLVALVIAAYLIGFWPTWCLRDTVLGHFGMPAYEGMWILIPHAFLYSTLSAAFCGLCWFVLVRIGWLKPPSFALSLKTILLGIAAGAAALTLLVGYLYFTGQGNAFHEPDIDPWIMGGNVFSNFFEEFIFRGFMLVALTAAFGFWPAAVLSSIAFGAVHTQFPIELQALTGVMGLGWAIAWRWSKSLLAPFIGHMTLDWIIAPLL